MNLDDVVFEGPAYILDSKALGEFGLCHVFEDRFLLKENCNVDWELGEYKKCDDIWSKKVAQLKILYQWIILEWNSLQKSLVDKKTSDCVLNEAIGFNIFNYFFNRSYLNTMRIPTF